MALSGMAVFAGVVSGQLTQAWAQDVAALPSFKNTKWAMTATWTKMAPIKGDLVLKDSGNVSFSYEDGKKHIDGLWSGSATGDLKMSFNGGALVYTGKRDGDNLSGKMANSLTNIKGAFTATLNKDKK